MFERLYKSLKENLIESATHTFFSKEKSRRDLFTSVKVNRISLFEKKITYWVRSIQSMNKI